MEESDLPLSVAPGPVAEPGATPGTLSKDGFVGIKAMWRTLV